MTVAAVVLAAGRSTRAGRTNKLTAPIGGVPMVARVVDAVLGSPARPVVVVTGHEAPAVRAALAGRDVTFVHNPDFADGMATSIRTGVAALPKDTAGVVICLGDMPALSSGDIARLVAAFDAGGADICVPVTGERRGNPTLFARRFFPELQTLSGDTGARRLIAAHPDRVREVGMKGSGTLTDLDTEADIDAYNRTQNQ
jgi:molybdenum cofactor cytidylyltransferase